jgi:uncharacterized protein (TIGR02646 family)
VRYIDIESLRARPEAHALIEAADEAQREVEQEGDPEARKALIKARSQRWRNLRALLEQTDVRKKCWYTESKNPGTDDDVDHYRPKGAIEERKDHPGYWWEAFNWRNFRLSCHRANRLKRSGEAGETLGKGSHFPVLDEGMRWMSPSAPCVESPALLDPTNPSDPQLLTFLSNGRVDLAPAFDEDAIARERVENSRRYLHLDWEDFVEERTSLFARVSSLIEEGNAAAMHAADDPGAAQRLKKVAQDLIRLTKPDQYYSAAAIAYIRIHRSRGWVDRAVLPNIPGSQEA